MAASDAGLPSLTPYFIRAFYDWCVDYDFTPQIVVVVEDVDKDVQVPRSYVHDGKIALNISPTACGGLEITKEYIKFDARFSGQIEHIWIPIGNVVAIYSRENGACIPFELTRAEPAHQPGPGFSKV
jgi:stringent starvation protein B